MAIRALLGDLIRMEFHIPELRVFSYKKGLSIHARRVELTHLIVEHLITWLNASPFTLSSSSHSSNRADLPSDYAGSLSSDLASPISTGSSGGIDNLLSPNATSNSSGEPRRHGIEGGVAFAVSPGEARDTGSGRSKPEEEEEEQAYSSGGVNLNSAALLMDHGC